VDLVVVVIEVAVEVVAVVEVLVEVEVEVVIEVVVEIAVEVEKNVRVLLLNDVVVLDVLLVRMDKVDVNEEIVCVVDVV
jgi:hypothetical protein